MRRIAGALVLALGLLTPTAVVSAQDHDRDHAQQQHEWNANEDPHWHEYLKEHHKKDKDWAHASKREQRDYWKWRDAHPDQH